MKLGFIGLGKMGSQMSLRLLKRGFDLVVYDIARSKVEYLVKHGAHPASGLKELVDSLKPRRIIWTMLPSGKPSDEVLENLKKVLQSGDIVIDGSNSNYKRTRKFYEEFKRKGINLLDAGVSGGVYGSKEGFCIMVGGDREAFAEVEDIFKALSAEKGYRFIGEGGSGHYAKMVHNAIEYAMMESIAEGIAMLEENPFGHVDILEILDLWNHGSIIRSFLLEVARKALEKEDLEKVLPYVDDTGEGRWSVQTAIEMKVPVPLISSALMMRFISQKGDDNVVFKVLALMRHEFGGHELRRKE